MGVSINAHVYDVKELVQNIEHTKTKATDLTPGQFLEKVAPEYGAILGDKFVVIWNDYFDEYNPAVKFLNIVGRYFGIEDFWSSSYDRIEGAVEDESIYEQLGLDPYEDDEDA